MTTSGTEELSLPRRALSAIALALAVATMTSHAASASISRFYAGETEQNGFAYGETTTREGRTKLIYMFIDPLILTCEDSSTFLWGFGFFESQRGTPLGPDKRIEVEYRDVNQVATFQGRYWPRHARGVVDLTLAGLDANNQAMLCTSGEVAWDAEDVRVRRTVRPSFDTSQLDGISRMRITEGGDVLVRTRRL